MNAPSIRSRASRVILAFALALAGCRSAPTPAPSQELAAPGARPSVALELRFFGWREARGQVVAAIYRDADTFDGEGPPALSARLEVEGDSARWSVELEQGAAYAVKAYLDLDSDGELDRSDFGAPTEPYGFSNDARRAFGPPAWADARFELNGPETRVIRLR